MKKAMKKAMKSLIKVICPLVVATMASGLTYAHYQATHQYKTYVVEDRLGAGDTVEGVASQYYNFRMEDRSWNEFKDDASTRNAKLFAKSRVPQIGDVVEIECHERIER